MLRSDIPLPLKAIHFRDYDDGDGIDCDQAVNDVGIITIPWKCEVVRGELTVTETCAGATPPVIKMDKRPTAGSDVSRGDGDIGHFILSTTARGNVMYDEAAQGTILYPGNQVVVELTTKSGGAGKAGHVIPTLLVKHIPETMANLSNMVETA